jgi:hypothetical protein
LTKRASHDAATASSREAAGLLLLLADSRDGSVEHDVGVSERQLLRLRQCGDLVVLHEQNRSDAGLPGDEELLPERVVVGLAGLRAEDRELTFSRRALDEVLGRAPFTAPISAEWLIFIAVACALFETSVTRKVSLCPS